MMTATITMDVLLVEDDPRIARVVERALSDVGHRVEIAHDGLEGLTSAERGAHDLVVLDVMLPEKDGIEVARELRRQRLKTPILMLTARDAGRGPCQGYSGGYFCVALGPDGTVFADPQQIDTSVLPRPDIQQPTFATILISDEEQARVLLRRMPDGGLLVTGVSLAPTQASLHLLLIVLVGGGALGLLVTMGAAWFLSGRALVPIQQAFQQQQEFIADASHELRTPLTVLRSATDLLTSTAPGHWSAMASYSTTCARRSCAWSGWRRIC